MADDKNLRLTVRPGQCGCGCGEQVRATSKFRPGHDARTKGALLRCHRAGGRVTVSGDGKGVTMTPAEYAALVFSPVGVASWTRSADKS